jgi:hypothetical protein
MAWKSLDANHRATRVSTTARPRSTVWESCVNPQSLPTTSAFFRSNPTIAHNRLSMSGLACSHQPRLIALGVSKHKPTSCPKFFKHAALIGQMRVQPPMLLLLVNRRRICGTVSRSITIIGAVHLGHCHATGRGGPPLPGESTTADNPFPRMGSNPILRAIKSGTCPANCGRS